MTELMKRYERETGGSAWFSEINPEINEDYVTWLEAQLTPVPVTVRLPEKDQEVLSHYKSRYGREVTVRAEYFRKHQEEMDADECEADYDEKTDTYYCPEGWYELIDNWGDYSSVRIVEGAVDSWLPIPKM